MKVYFFNIDRREDFSEVGNIHKTRAGAILGMKEVIHSKYSLQRIKNSLKVYGGSLNEGVFHSEDETYTIIERELVD